MATKRFIQKICSFNCKSALQLQLDNTAKLQSQRLCFMAQRSATTAFNTQDDGSYWKNKNRDGFNHDTNTINYGGRFVLGFASTVVGVYLYNHSNTLLAVKEEDEKKEHAMSRREQRFHDFASYEYNGQIVMSPQDFIESITENHPRLSRRGKIRITERGSFKKYIMVKGWLGVGLFRDYPLRKFRGFKEGVKLIPDLSRYASTTPSMDDGSNTFLRDRHHDGIITYSEYLFLVTVLTKSYTGLKTALKLMDVNGDHVISMEEFQLIVQMINKSASQNTRGGEDHLSTTLSLHLFGKNGDELVAFERFFKFMDDLQSEVLELEFHEYSKSMKTISEIDFAKILLRNTTLSEQEYCEYIDRLKERLEFTKVSKGITLDQFKAFHTFLSNLEDFVIAINMTNLLNQAVDKELFARSIKVTTGQDIDPYVIDVVFSLFDQDGDGKLSQNEFIGIMKDRLKRGFGKFPNTSGFAGFKHCLKKEMIK